MPFGYETANYGVGEYVRGWLTRTVLNRSGRCRNAIARARSTRSARSWRSFLVRDLIHEAQRLTHRGIQYPASVRHPMFRCSFENQLTR